MTTEPCYSNTGLTDQSNDFEQSFTTFTHSTDKYIIAHSSSGYNLSTIIPLTNKSLNNHKLSFDLYIEDTNNTNDCGFGLNIGVPEQNESQYSAPGALLGVNNKSRITYKTYGASRDSYRNISLSNVFDSWKHWEYVFENNTVTMNIYDGDTLLVTHTMSLDSSVLSTTGIAYRLSAFWASGTRYIKNIAVNSL